MGIYKSFTQEERNTILAKMSVGQRDFLMSTLKRGRATAFANTLLTKLAETTNVPAAHLFMECADFLESEWELIEIIDAGQVTDSLKCECGRSLRFQYIVRNNLTNETLKLGKTHLALHMGIPEHIAQAVINNLMKIDFELDEILDKYELIRKKQDNYMDSYWESHLFLFDDAIVKQFELGIPFLDNQIIKLNKLISEHQKYSRVIVEGETAADLQVLFDKKSSSDNTNQVTFDFDSVAVAPSAALNRFPNQSKGRESKSNVEEKDKYHWSERMEIQSKIESTHIYRFDLFDDIQLYLNRGLNSVNAIVEQLLLQEKYRNLFARCTARMCYIIVTGRITEGILSGAPIIRKSRADRQDTYYFFE